MLPGRTQTWLSTPVSRTHTECPKCGHKLPQALPDSASCPACGIYFFKYQPDTDAPHTLISHADQDAAGASWLAYLLAPLPAQDSVSYYARCAALVFLSLWSVTLFGYDYQDGEIGTSFMHLILLPIHEAGHVLLMPFGEFMTILGGSFFQLALPFAIGIAFMHKNRDNYAAALCLWWTSVSLVDLAPYIYDARHPQLILLGGHTGEDGPHDWVYLLSRIGQLNHAQDWGAFAHTLGGLFMLLAIGWAALLLYRPHH